MSEPIVSVIIPTNGRPSWLPVAVASALAGLDDRIEVVVVPNGGDESWRESLRAFAGDARVRVTPVADANANIARNHGLDMAVGRYVRFLDDDDALFPGVSLKQCELLEASGADICSGTVQLVDASGAIFQTWKQPQTADFVESILMPGRVAHPCAHVFRRASLSGCRWDPSVDLGQDTHWMHSLVRQREWKWVSSNIEAGIWRHHPGPRISSGSRRSRHLQISAAYLLDTAANLEAQGRLDARRRAAAVAGLWRMIHSGFFMAPAHWTTVMRATRRLGPGTFPDIALYQSALGRAIPPLLLEWVMLPKRWLNNFSRTRKVRSGRMASVLPP